MSSSLYPPSPTQLPNKLTSLSSSYQLKAALAIAAIILFFVLYLLLVVTMGALVYLAITYPMIRVGYLALIIKMTAIGGSVMLLLFTLKFMLKLKPHKNPLNRIKLDKKQEPVLWNFIERICHETDVAYPKTVYLTPDVNAFASYSNVWLSLFLPVEKELTLGLGLISCLNLSELKAVISHEFGHFSQSSMRIGSYIISANAIIFDMIYSRDRWDVLLEQWRNSGTFISLGAWVITPVIWFIRFVLGLFYQMLNVMYLSLMREMEFNADKMAVSTSGSQAIVSALWKLERGDQYWRKTLGHAYAAAQKKIFTENLYTHNDQAIINGKEEQNKVLATLPDDGQGGKQLFLTSENSKVGMYESHPPNDKREENAKNPYISCEIDDRSSWLLFENKEVVQEQLTNLVYQKYIRQNPKEYVRSEEFEAFINAETKDQTLLKEYYDTFKDRFIQIPLMEELEEAAQVITNPSSNDLEQLKEELLDLLKPIEEVDGLLEMASEMREGKTTQKSFSFQGKTYDKNTLSEGFKVLVEEKERLFGEHFKQWDQDFLAYHLALAKQQGKDTDLKKLYIQHQTLSQIYHYASLVKNTILIDVATLQEQEMIVQKEVNDLSEHISNLLVSINEKLDLLDEIEFVPLPNIDSVEELKETIVEGKEFKRGPMLMFEEEAFEQLMEHLDLSLIHCQRIDQKSIGVILAFHKSLLE